MKFDSVHVVGIFFWRPKRDRFLGPAFAVRRRRAGGAPGALRAASGRFVEWRRLRRRGGSCCGPNGTYSRLHGSSLAQRHWMAPRHGIKAAAFRQRAWRRRGHPTRGLSLPARRGVGAPRQTAPCSACSPCTSLGARCSRPRRLPPRTLPPSFLPPRGRPIHPGGPTRAPLGPWGGGGRGGRMGALEGSGGGLTGSQLLISRGGLRRIPSLGAWAARALEQRDRVRCPAALAEWVPRLVKTAVGTLVAGHNCAQRCPAALAEGVGERRRWDSRRLDRIDSCRSVQTPGCQELRVSFSEGH